MDAKRWVIAGLIALSGIAGVSAQTSTDTPTPTPTPTATPTPTPDVMDDWTLEPSGQAIAMIYEVTPADYVSVPLLAAILLSMWGAFLIVIYVFRRR